MIRNCLSEDERASTLLIKRANKNRKKCSLKHFFQDLDSVPPLFKVILKESPSHPAVGQARPVDRWHPQAFTLRPGHHLHRKQESLDQNELKNSTANAFKVYSK